MILTPVDNTFAVDTIDHDLLLNWISNKHIDWTSASDNFLTSGTGQFTGNLGVNLAPDAGTSIYTDRTSSISGVAQWGIRALLTQSVATMSAIRAAETIITSTHPSGLIIAIEGYRGGAVVNGNGTLLSATGMYGYAIGEFGASITAAVSGLRGIVSFIDIEDLVVTNAYGIEIIAPQINTGSATNVMGIHSPDVTVGTNNWSALFEGDVQINSGKKLILEGAFGTKGDTYLAFDSGNNWIEAWVNNNEILRIEATALTIGAGAAGVDYQLKFTGETNSGLMTWMEDEDYLRFSDDIAFTDGEFLIFDKASGNGVKVDTATPVFGWRDLLGQIRTRGVGATDPNDAVYRGNIKAYQFIVNDEAWIDYHIPHDYVMGTDIHLHFHWSHTSAIVTGGSVTWGADVTYAKGHDQAVFPATVNPTVVGNASTTQYQHMLDEVQISAASPSAVQIDTDDLEPDGVIMVRVYLVVNNITSGGAVPDPFLHFADIHYQSTNIATKNKVSDFYT